MIRRRMFRWLRPRVADLVLAVALVALVAAVVWVVSVVVGLTSHAREQDKREQALRSSVAENAAALKEANARLVKAGKRPVSTKVIDREASNDQVSAAVAVYCEAFGCTGPQGASGRPGVKGATGLQGATGPAGAAGEKGDKGDTGPTGPAGPEGPTGQKGDTGPQGPAGPTCPDGYTGQELTVVTTSGAQQVYACVAS